MSNKEDGGLALPFFDERVMNSPEWGITMRDYFAAKAMQGRLAVPGYVDVEQDAAMAYRMADAMLKERAK